MNFLEVKGVSKSFSQNPYDRHIVLEGVNLEIPEGEFAVITGFSGSGKSTLLSLLSGRNQPDSGTISLRGSTLASATTPKPWSFGENSIDQDLTTGMAVRLKKKNPAAQSIEWILESCGLAEKQETPVSLLSSGDLIRLNLALALMSDAELVLIDEAFIGLNRQEKFPVMMLVADLMKSFGKTVVMMTNDLEDAILCGDRVFPLQRGAAATLGPGFVIPIPRPRDVATTVISPVFHRLRMEIMSHLTGQSQSSLASHRT